MAEDPYLAFELRAISIPAADAFRAQAHNRKYYNHVPAPSKGAATSSRASTPATNAGYDECDNDSNDGIADDVDEPNFGHCLRFTLDKPGRPEGWTFGSDPNKCDVLLGTRAEGISGVHCRITYDDQFRLVLIDQSTHGTAVSYGNQARHEKRKNPADRQRNKKRDCTNDFSWILFPEIANKRVIIGHMIAELPHAPVIEFSVHIAIHKATQKRHAALRAAYVEETRNAIPFDLDIESHVPTAGHTSPHPPRSQCKQPSVWIDGEEIGSGEYAVVYKTVDVSSGEVFAAKTLLRQKKEILQRWDKEVKILSSISHDHIVKYVDHDTKRQFPRLIMEYLPLGNLARQNETSRLNGWETITLTCQGLEALAYMHSLEIAHRDLKPENILVCAREPGSAFSIKIADFGLAIDRLDMKTACGTELYCAPEIWENDVYSVLVDVWSLGVVALQYTTTSLPNFSYKGSTGEKSWHARLVKHAVDYDSDAFVHLLSSCMLQTDPRHRLPAADCLEKATRILAGTPLIPDIDPGTPTEAMSSSSWSITLKGARSYTYGGVGGEQTTMDPASFLSLSTIIEVENSLVDGPYVSEPSGLNEKSYESRDTSSPTCSPTTKRRRLGEAKVDLINQRQSFWGQSKDQGLICFNAELDCLEMIVEGRTVAMRRSDCYISAADLCRLAGTDDAVKIRIRKLLREHVPAIEASGNGASSRMWIPFTDGRFLCEYLHLANTLKPLLQYGQEHVTLQEHRTNYFLEGTYLQVGVGQFTVWIRGSDLWLNATHILKAGKLDYRQEAQKLKMQVKYEVVKGGGKRQGFYVSPSTAFALCEEHLLLEMKEILRTTLEAHGYQHKVP